MDQIGWIDDDLIERATIRVFMDNRASKDVYDSNEAFNRENGYQQSLDVLRDLSNSSVGTILFMEHYYIVDELDHTTNPKKEASLLRGIDQVKAAREMLSLTEDPIEYKKMIKQLAPHEKEKDLPEDPVRRFFSSHKKRLNNSITYASNDSKGQLAILNQRLLNIQKAERLYMQVQRQILGDDWREQTDRSLPKRGPSPTNGSQNISTEEIKKQIADYEAQKIAYTKKCIERLPQSLQYGYALKAKKDFDKQHAEEAKEIADLKKILEESESKEPKQKSVQNRRDRGGRGD